MKFRFNLTATLKCCCLFVLLLIPSVVLASSTVKQDIKKDSLTKQASTKQTVKKEPSNEVTLLFAGDAMQHAAQFKSAFDPKTKTYDYSKNFTNLESIIKQADIAVVNLETTLGGEPYSSFPQFSSPDSFAKQLQTSGFDILMLANNHSNDRWSRGVKRTIQTLDDFGITHSGTYQSTKEHNQNSPLMIKKNGLNLAFLNYTFATNGIKSVFDEQTKLISFKQMRKDIKQAKLNKADSIIVYIHWGNEYQLEPSKYQLDVAKFLIDSKVDLIIGSHPHVVQPMIWQKAGDDQEKQDAHEYVLAYSLGNFISNQRDLQQAGGALLQVTLKKQTIEKADETKISDVGYYLTFVDRTIVGNKYQHQVLPVRQFQTQLDLIDWQQYGLLLKYAVWASNFLNQQNINVPEFAFKNNKWQLEAIKKETLND